MTGYATLVAALEDQGRVAPSWGEGTMAHCPGPMHTSGDARPSLHVTEGDDGKPLFFCFVGCDAPDILDALGLSWGSILDGSEAPASGRVVAHYTYVDADGDPVYRKVRVEPKGFYQERWESRGGIKGVEGGEWVKGGPRDSVILYQLPTVLEAVKKGVPVYVVEGEKDVHTIEATQTGVIATTSGGATSWSPACTEALRGANVTIVGDRDDAGRKHVEQVLAEIGGVVASVRVAWPLEGKDVTDHIYAGHSLAELSAFEAVDLDDDDWADEPADVDWLEPGLLARRTLVWAYGPTESAKSMALMGIAADLSRRGEHVRYYGEEMDRATEANRIARFRPDRRYFHWKNGRGLDLSDPEQVSQVIAETRGMGLCIFDSYERVWGNVRANENRRAVEFARMAHNITISTGATVVVIDHTGFGFRDADGNLHDQTEPRGASAKRQQADTAILFSKRGEWIKGEPYRFRIQNKKPGRIGNPFDHNMLVVDTADGGLAVVHESLHILGAKEAHNILGVSEASGSPRSGAETGTVDGGVSTPPEPSKPLTPEALKHEHSSGQKWCAFCGNMTPEPTARERMKAKIDQARLAATLDDDEREALRVVTEWAQQQLSSSF